MRVLLASASGNLPCKVLVGSCKRTESWDILQSTEQIVWIDFFSCMWINVELMCDIYIKMWSKTWALVCQSSHNKAPQWLKEMCFPTVLASRNLRSRYWQVWLLLRFLFLACRLLSSIAFSHHLPFVHVCVQVFYSYKNTSQIGWGFTLIIPF